MKIVSTLFTIIIVIIIIPLLSSQPSFNGSSPGCSGSGCHSFQDGLVSAITIDNLQVQITIAGTTSRVAGELVDDNGNVVDYVNSTTSNPFILTAPSEGSYIINAGFKNPSRKWDSTSVVFNTLVPPVPPSNLVATVIQNPLSVELNWTDNSDNEDGFVIEREVAVGDVYEVIDTVAANVTSYIDTNVIVLTYNYRVGAFNAAGSSAFSDPAQVVVPVELVGFIAKVVNNGVVLEWATATENNNFGFEVQRRTNNSWLTIGFVNGSGSTTEITHYQYLDKLENYIGNVYYMLKQNDLDGSYSYSDVIIVEVNSVPENFMLSQNYPNPFNPSTVIEYSLPAESKVLLVVYNLIGEKVDELANDIQQGGTHTVQWKATGFSSGIYYYKLDVKETTGNEEKTFIKKMILLK